MSENLKSQLPDSEEQSNQIQNVKIGASFSLKDPACTIVRVGKIEKREQLVKGYLRTVTWINVIFVFGDEKYPLFRYRKKGNVETQYSKGFWVTIEHFCKLTKTPESSILSRWN